VLYGNFSVSKTRCKAYSPLSASSKPAGLNWGTSLWNFFPELKKNFSSRQGVGVVNKSCCFRRRRSRLLTTPTRQPWLVTTSRSAVYPELHYFDLLWISRRRTTCFYSWQDSDSHSASAVAELFFQYGGLRRLGYVVALWAAETSNDGRQWSAKGSFSNSCHYTVGLYFGCDCNFRYYGRHQWIGLTIEWIRCL